MYTRQKNNLPRYILQLGMSKTFSVESSNGDATLPFNYFQKTNIITKKGKETKHLKLLKTDAGMVFLVNFVDNILAN